MSFVDFKIIKDLATIESIAAWLNLPLKQNRMRCPQNDGDPRELVLFPETQSFRCFGCKKSGDSIELVSHINQVSQKQAALDIQSKFHGYVPDKRGLPPDGLDYLQADHAAVIAMGFDPIKAKELGIGYSPKGTMRNFLMVPIRDKSGALKGYIGLSPGTTIKLPSDFKVQSKG